MSRHSDGKGLTIDDEVDRPFDARQAWMDEDQDGPLAEWRTVSLVTCLRQTLLERARGERRQPRAGQPDLPRLSQVADELTTRGVDGDALIRYGIASEVVLRTLIDLVLDELFPAESGSYDFNEDWRKVFHLDHPTVKEKISKFPQDPELVYESIRELLTGHGVGPVTIAFARVNCWASNVADLDALLEFRAPSAEELAEVSISAPDSETMAAYRWIIDRFSGTYYAEWATESLHSEWRWQRGIGAPPCPVNLTTEPLIRLGDLEHQIASRAVLDSPPNSPIIAAPLAHQVAPHARSLLQDGKVEQAAALFEFACKQDPDNPDLRNNLGFCLVPSAPRVALGHLEAARRLGYSPVEINAYNRMCCLVSIGRPALAVKEYEHSFVEWQDGVAVVPAIVWVMRPEGNYVIVDTDDVREDARNLAELARKLHDRRAQDSSSLERSSPDD